MRPVRLYASAIALVLLAGAPGIAADAAKGAKAAKSSTASESTESKVDADAMEALDRMGAELRSHQTFAVKSDVTMAITGLTSLLTYAF